MSDGADRYARLAAQLLRAQAGEAEPEPTSDERRDKIVAAMALAMAAKRRRRRTIFAAGAVFAAAAAVLLTVRVAGGHGPVAPGAQTALVVEGATGSANLLLRGSAPQALVHGSRLLEGDTVEAEANGSTTLGFSNGTSIVLSAASRLRVDELAATRRFSLGRGRLRAHVAKLVQDERFIVSTPDAEVEVHGTVFDVSVGPAGGACGAAVRSTVEVTQGAVWVRSRAGQVVLLPGQAWTSPCPSADAKTQVVVRPASGATPPAVHPAESRALPPVGRPSAPAAYGMVRHATSPRTVAAAPVAGSDVPPAPRPAVPATVESPAPRQPISHLAEQNDLFSAAMAAEHQNDHATAVRKLDELIRRFPTGPLFESARAERQRIVSAGSK